MELKNILRIAGALMIITAIGLAVTPATERINITNPVNEEIITQEIVNISTEAHSLNDTRLIATRIYLKKGNNSNVIATKICTRAEAYGEEFRERGICRLKYETTENEREVYKVEAEAFFLKTLEPIEPIKPIEPIEPKEPMLHGEEKVRDDNIVPPTPPVPIPPEKPYPPHMIVVTDVIKFVMNTTGQQVNQPPMADAGGPYSCTPGETIQLDASNSTDADGNVTSYEWDLDNDGNYSDSYGQVVNYTCTTEGNKTVWLKVTDDENKTDTDKVIVTVKQANQAPTANFTIEKVTRKEFKFNANQSEDTDGNITSYEWNFGDGTNATGEETTHQYSSKGTYTVTLTVTDDDGGQTTMTQTVEVEKKQSNSGSSSTSSGSSVSFSSTTNTGPEVDAGEDMELYIGEKAEFNPEVVDNGEIVRYRWDFDNDGDWDYESTETGTTTHTYKQAGTYTVEIQVKDDGGILATDTLQVEVKEKEKEEQIDFQEEKEETEGFNETRKTSSEELNEGTEATALVTGSLADPKVSIPILMGIILLSLATWKREDIKQRIVNNTKKEGR